jgi:Kdo2-lipid IVA lauroyltransferase/acyltransferase
MFYILYGFLYLVSLLPFFVLYGISNAMYVLLYYILKYRIAVTRANLAFSFPEKTIAERHAIEKQFYKNLCDSVVENIKLLSISKATLNKRFDCNWDLVNAHQGQGRITQAYLSHCFNWEYGTLAANWNVQARFTGLYNPISNKAFDKLIFKIRSRSGGLFIDMNNMQKEMAGLQKQDICWGFVADQNPSEPRRSAWEMFLNRETAFFKGPELVARRYNNIVFFAQILRVKRGYFKCIAHVETDNPRDLPDGELTKRYVAFLEKCIHQQPDNWVWSHRRWKHQRTENN